MPAKKKSRVLSRGNPQPSSSVEASTRKTSHAADHVQATRALVRRSPSRSKNDLWIAPRTSFTRQDNEVMSWSLHSRPLSEARLLELADIALGLRKPQPFRKSKSLFLTQNAKRSN
jgi:hypothetical protein